VTIGCSLYRSHLGNATPKGGLAFFWESFVIIFLIKLAKCS
jgi:hypothetical protein